MEKLNLSQIVRLGFICALVIVMIFFFKSMQDTQTLKSGQVIIPPELKQLDNGVSIRLTEPLLCVGDKCEILTEKMFSIIDQGNQFQLYLISIAILILGFEIVELFKYRLVKK